MKNYKTPEFEIITVADVIATSGDIVYTDSGRLGAIGDGVNMQDGRAF